MSNQDHPTNDLGFRQMIAPAATSGTPPPTNQHRWSHSDEIYYENQQLYQEMFGIEPTL